MSAEWFGLLREPLLTREGLFIVSFLVSAFAGILVDRNPRVSIAGIAAGFFVLPVAAGIGVDSGVAAGAVIAGICVGAVVGVGIAAVVDIGIGDFAIVKMLIRLCFVLARVWTAIRSCAASRQSVGVTPDSINRTVAQALFAGAFSLLPGHIREEFGDAPIHHFLKGWNKRERGRWSWALAEIVQVVWVAGRERMRGAWQAVVQK